MLSTSFCMLRYFFCSLYFLFVDEPLLFEAQPFLFNARAFLLNAQSLLLSTTVFFEQVHEWCRHTKKGYPPVRILWITYCFQLLSLRLSSCCVTSSTSSL